MNQRNIGIISLINRVFPDGTFRGEFKNIVLTSFRIILNQGFRSFLGHAQKKIKRREFRIVKFTQYTFHQLNDFEIYNIIKEIKNLNYKPRFSVLMPVYNPNPQWLKAAINSVINQLYWNWELCICDDGSTVTETRKILQEYLKIDTRIKVIFSNTNEGISKATNKALTLATGEFVALLDHDDELTIDALYEAAKALNADQNIDFIYSDEDKISADGEYVEPFLKPDFSMEMLRSMNYLIHLAIIRRTLVELVGGFNNKFDGAQDFDLFFRILEKTDRVHHIRKILYHWRKSPISGAYDPLAKPWIYERGKSAIEKHLERLGIEATVKIGYGWGLYKVDYKINGEPAVDIIIPTRKISLFKKCIKSLKENTTYQNYNVWAVINGNSDYEIIQIKSRHGDELERFVDKKTGLIGPRLVYNWSRMNNLAVSFTNSQYIIFMNDDVEIITKDWIENLLQYAQFDHVGAVGIMLLYKDTNTIQHAGDFISEIGTGDHCFNGMASNSFEINGLAQVVRECSAVTSACMMVKRDIFKKIGGFDENLRNFDDYDFCLRLREAGYSIIYTPYAKAYHHESPTRPQVHDDKTLDYLLKKHKPTRYDPFYRYEWINMYNKIRRR